MTSKERLKTITTNEQIDDDFTVHRSKGCLALGTVLKLEKNIKTIEMNVYKHTKDLGIQEYLRCISQVVFDIKNGKKLKSLNADIKKGGFGWGHVFFKEMADLQAEQDDFIINPFEVEEGVLTCSCGSKRVYSYSKQVKSADEGFSTFATCVACKKQWVHGG